MRDFAINILTAPAGKAYLFSTGQAGFIIKSSGGNLLGIDLYLTDCVERIEGHMGYHRLMPKILSPHDLMFDVIIATHPHKDHFDDDAIPILMSNENMKLFASVECEKEVHRLNMSNERITYVRPGEQYTVKDFQLKFVNCDHGKGAPDAVGVIVVVGGKRIYFAGDTCIRPDRRDEYLAGGAIDVMVAPINGAYGNMNEKECVSFAALLSPKLTIPCHYGMFAAHGGDPDKFCHIMKAQSPQLEFRLLTQGERIEL